MFWNDPCTMIFLPREKVFTPETILNHSMFLSRSFTLSTSNIWASCCTQKPVLECLAWGCCTSGGFPKVEQGIFLLSLSILLCAMAFKALMDSSFRSTCLCMVWWVHSTIAWSVGRYDRVCWKAMPRPPGLRPNAIFISQKFCVVKRNLPDLLVVRPVRFDGL